ncbi:MAG: cytochrome c biogenesis protein CcdA, partial [Phycisphaerae bacterium]|nr:cytochrome c biogenesis protein CcdA [Phycisphaerae bacterium]
MIALLEGIETCLRDSLTQAPILAVAVAFVGGILASFTPCVYPMIPIIVGYIGSSQERSRLRAFLLSLFYVIGMALTFAILGVVAALTGGFMGEVQSKPYPHIIVGSIIVLFALSLLGVFALPIPQFLKRGPAKKRRGFFGALSMGFASGFIAAPCTAAVLGVLLVYVGSRQNVVFGVVTLFSFAMGL